MYLPGNCCKHADGRVVACMGSAQAVGVPGGAKRRLPVGTAANGIPRYWNIEAAAEGADAAGSGTKGTEVPITTPDAIVMVGFVPEARSLKGADQTIVRRPKTTGRRLSGSIFFWIKCKK